MINVYIYIYMLRKNIDQDLLITLPFTLIQQVYISLFKYQLKHGTINILIFIKFNLDASWCDNDTFFGILHYCAWCHSFFGDFIRTKFVRQAGRVQNSLTHELLALWEASKLAFEWVQVMLSQKIIHNKLLLPKFKRLELIFIVNYIFIVQN